MENTGIKSVVAEGENESVEFKESFGDDVIISLVSFANSHGGKVIVGVNRKKKVVGASVSGESVQQWVNEVKAKTFRELLPSAQVHTIEGKRVVVLSVLEHPLKPVSFKGKFFVRRQNSNHVMSAHEIAEEVNRLKNTSLDSVLMAKFSMNDLDFREINRVIGRINMRKEVKLSKNPREFLVKYNLVEGDTPTLAALLLFGKNYGAYRAIQAGVFQSDMVIKDELVCEDFLARQVEELLEFVKKHISKMTFILPQPENVQKWEYPLEALRELITNVVVHRDYRETASIRIYPGKIIFSNYGGLPADYSVEDFIKGKRASYIRNKLIARVFKDATIMEEYSSGLKRVNKVFIANGNPAPEFTVDTHSFTVTTISIAEKKAPDKVGEKGAERGVEEGVENLSKAELKIIELVKRQPTISKQGIMDMGSLSKKTVEYNIAKLKQKGILKRIGPDRGGHWQVLGGGSE